MRASQSKHLLEIERHRTSWRYGFRARVRQLKVATAVTLVLYVVSRYYAWRRPRPPTHVWIDEVLVEVLEERWADQVSSALLTALMFFGAVLLAFLLCARPERGERRERHGARAADAWARRGQRSGGDDRIDDTSIAPMRGFDTAPPRRDAATTGAPSPPPPRVDPMRPMRTSADLESFLQRASLEHRRQQRTAAAPVQDSFFAGSAPSSPSPLVGGAVQVRYDSRGAARGGVEGQSGEGGRAGLSDREWAALGIRNVDAALERTREWVSGLCRRLLEEVDESDGWFERNDARAYSCSHSLQEVLPAPAPAPAPAAATGWGAPAAAAPPLQPQTISKQAALFQQRALIQRSNHRDYDTVLRYDQRVALEARLDVTGTFPEEAGLSNAELSARQQYVVARLRAMAKQRSLSLYRHSTGDPDSWREGFPCDAHLLLHIVRSCVDGMGSYVRFGHQGGARGQDLALYVGDTGEPYFYVRHRGHAQDRLYPTRPGAQSLFEAILIFAAVINVYYDGTYGGIRGAMALDKTGLAKVVREPNFSGGWTGTF